MLARLKVRTKLLAILLPLLLGLGVLATLGVSDRLDQRSTATRTQHLVSAAKSGATLVHQLQTERLLTAALQSGYAPAAAQLDKVKIETDRAVADLQQQIGDVADLDGSIGGQAPSQVATSVRQQLDNVAKARAVYNPTAGDALAVIDIYTSVIDALVAIDGQLLLSAQGLEGSGVSVHWLSAVKEADARSAADAAVIVAATANGSLTDASWAITEVKELRAQAISYTKVFTTDTTEFGRQVFDQILQNPAYSNSQAAFTSLSSIDPAKGIAITMPDWLRIAQGRIDTVRKGEVAIFDREIAAANLRASDLESQVRLYLAGTITALLLGLLLATSVTRSITTSLRRLTEAARTISTEQLPKLVESLNHPEVEQHLQATHIDLRSEDEFAELAAAFQAVEQTALDVAAEQNRTLRKGISEIFVNLARRNQSLLDRQIEFIDRLEANEEDPDQLENLFKLDHLATRMRRNAESLLVLAGAEAPRRRAREVSLTDVIRVAVGEVEDFARITLLAVDEAQAVGTAAVDVAHLLSELMENGTQYSPPDRRVEVVGHRTNDGGYVISLTDHGVGMSAEAMSTANELLAQPPVVGLSLSRSLGFIVVSTLARRHAISVRLTEAAAGGVTALVTLPPSLLVQPEPALVDSLPEPTVATEPVAMFSPIDTQPAMFSPDPWETDEWLTASVDEVSEPSASTAEVPEPGDADPEFLPLLLDAPLEEAGAGASWSTFSVESSAAGPDGAEFPEDGSEILDPDVERLLAELADHTPANEVAVTPDAVTAAEGGPAAADPAIAPENEPAVTDGLASAVPMGLAFERGLFSLLDPATDPEPRADTAAASSVIDPDIASTPIEPIRRTSMWQLGTSADQQSTGGLEAVGADLPTGSPAETQASSVPDPEAALSEWAVSPVPEELLSSRHWEPSGQIDAPTPIAQPMPPLIAESVTTVATPVVPRSTELPARREHLVAAPSPFDAVPAPSTARIAPDVATPPSAPALPRRSRTLPSAHLAPTTGAERISAPSRPPEEVRNILSRYRSGLQSGRVDTPPTPAGGSDDARVSADENDDRPTSEDLR